MLSLVLGASTHSFELMLASFILGLALGRMWVRIAWTIRRSVRSSPRAAGDGARGGRHHPGLQRRVRLHGVDALAGLAQLAGFVLFNLASTSSRWW
jgi:hypothetical protein